MPSLTEDDASPVSPPLPRRPTGPLTFLSPEPEEPSQPLPSPEEKTSSPADPPAGSPSEPGSPSDEAAADESAPTSSRGSSGGNALKPLGKAALKATTAQAVLIGSAMAHRIAARTEGQRAVALYMADEEDADNIADPLADILHRHGGIAGGAMNPDTADAVRMLLGLAGFASKQIVRIQQAREIDGHLAGGGTLEDLNGPVDV